MVTDNAIYEKILVSCDPCSSLSVLVYKVALSHLRWEYDSADCSLGDRAIRADD